MSQEDRVFIAGAVASTLYLCGVFIAGLVWGNKAAVLIDLIAIGSCYLQVFALQQPIPFARLSSVATMVLSIFLGALAGVILLARG